MEIRTCYSCGSSKHKYFTEENGFNIVKCNVCGLLFVKNRPDDNEISEARKQGVHGGLNSLDVTGVYDPNKIPIYLKVLDDLFEGDLCNKRNWLDVGCGHGEFMEAVQQYSAGKIAVIGSEPNVHKQKSAEQRHLNVGYLDIDTHNETYDIISLLNVYSHLTDPPDFLSSVKKNLKPSGELILETGNTAELSFEDHYRPFYLPDHLSFASESIVVGILERLGYEIICIKKYPLIRFSIMRYAKDLIKCIMPKAKSNFRYYRKIYSQSDMYIRAILRC